MALVKYYACECGNKKKQAKLCVELFRRANILLSLFLWSNLRATRFVAAISSLLFISVVPSRSLLKQTRVYMHFLRSQRHKQTSGLIGFLVCNLRFNKK